MSDRWQEIEELFEKGLERCASERELLLASVHPEIAQLVRGLWASHEEAGSFLEAPIVSLKCGVFTTGQVLAGRFVIEEFIGAGGMGEVYRAKDRQLPRRVAIKALHQHLAKGAQAARKTEREARALSELDHPRICTIYDIGREGEIPFLIMQFLVGETLATRIARGPLPLSELLTIAEQVLEGLAYAHEHGVIHRDLKPSNIMLTKVGVKILDFGIAKHMRSAGSGGGTVTRSDEEVVAGSAAYMSPEQAEGKNLDHRSDLFSFGAVLYEMTTGRRAFQGDSPLSILADILRVDPEPIRRFAPAAPLALVVIVERCLRKSPEDRYADVRQVLESVHEVVRSQTTSARTRWRAALVLAALTVLGAGSVLLWKLANGRPPQSAILELRRVTADGSASGFPDLSSDGEFLVYTSDRSGSFDLWLQPTSGGNPIQLTSHPGEESEPVFSPDGAQIAFYSEQNGGGIFVMPVSGGSARRIARAGRFPRYSPDGRHLAYWEGDPWDVTRPSKVFVRAVEGGASRQLAKNLRSPGWPVFSPQGEGILLFQVEPPSYELVYYYAGIDGTAAVRTDGFSEHHELGLENPTVYDWIDGFLVASARLGSGNNLWLVPFDAVRLRVSGDPIRLTSGASQEAWAKVRGSKIIFHGGEDREQVWVLPLDDRGTASAEPSRVSNSTLSNSPELTSDGRLLAYSSFLDGNPAIVLRSLDTGVERPLSLRGLKALRPRFLDDNRSIAFSVSNMAGSVNAYRSSLDGGDLEELSENCVSPIPSASGKWLLCGQRGDDPLGSVTMLEIASGRESRILSDTGGKFYHLRTSPDDRWISFSFSDDLRISKIFIAPFGGSAIPKSAWIPLSRTETFDGWPAWSQDGRILYFLSDRDGFRCIWAQPLEPETKWPIGDPVPIYHAHGTRRLKDVPVGGQNLSVGGNKVVFVLPEHRMSVWTADFGLDF